nr:hypothetical protein [Sedimentibacter sp.]
MGNNYTNKLMDLYVSKCASNYNTRTALPDENIVRDVEGITNKVGYLNIYVFTGKEQIPIANATVTVYVRKGDDLEIPIMRFITSTNPILIQIPVAYSPDTLIVGPEYSFSTYNLRVEASGYYITRILNIRMFPGIVTDFNVSMIPTTESSLAGSGEQIINIPPHPRDIIAR